MTGHRPKLRAGPVAVVQNGRVHADRDERGGDQLGGDRAIRELGRRGFENGPLYDAARPTYPDEALARLVATFDLGAATRAVDLGAGTGIFTRQLLSRVGSLTAVEPSASMREVLEASTPGVTVLDGRDVAIPLADDSADLVVVAQAFHWFDAPRALAEIHRVLAPGGGLALIWNERDESVDWMRDLSAAMRWNEHRPYSSNTDFAAIVRRGPFGDVEHHRFTHAPRLSHEQIYQRVLTTSYISIMDDAARHELMAAVRDVVEPLDEPVAFPYVTDLYTAHAVAVDRSVIRPR